MGTKAERKGRELDGTSAAVGPQDGTNGGAGHPVRQVMVTRVGLQIPDRLTYDVWEQVGHRISQTLDSVAWCLGDWINYGRSRFEDRYRRAVDAVGLEYQTIRNYAWVARQVEVSRRRAGLSFQHHAEVAALGPEEQDMWLGRAEECDWSRNQLRRSIRDARRPGTASAERNLLPAITAAPERIARWRSAAEHSHVRLEDWVVLKLDAAAAAELDVDSPHDAVAG
ncbi:LmbU family transcriptional regulator [Streptomyces sp. NBC_00448]|uniref:LmbU family transcriptional regulator n=1 Tax=Streptomyces sp. NBC_00448 TaxID=2903652 RepID=UPI002E23912C